MNKVRKQGRRQNIISGWCLQVDWWFCKFNQDFATLVLRQGKKVLSGVHFVKGIVDENFNRI